MSLGISEEPLEEPQLPGTSQGDESPIARLRPGSELHARVLERLLRMYNSSKREMHGMYNRWRAAELQYQAYMRTETFEQLCKNVKDKGTPPELVTLTVPYSYAAVQTRVTYMLHTFCGRSPMFQVGSYRSDTVQKAQKVETLLQYNGDHERIVGKLFQFFLDGEMYGLQVLRVLWKTEQRKRTVWKVQNPLPFLGNMGGSPQPVAETATVFEGNELRNIDPFRFFPDPRVPMSEVADKGEFVFWKELEGKFRLKKAERDGLVKWIDSIPGRRNRPAGDSDSERGRLTGGRTSSWGIADTGADSIDLLQGTVEIVPSEWGLGDSDYCEKWLFSIGNEQQIIQAEPLDLDHGKHPVVVGEPFTSGYEFGQMSGVDMLGPMQEMLSWMFNSHIFNVRSVLNNTLVVNPQMVDIQDLKRPGPGRVIKLKPAAFGQDIKNAISQLPVADVTQGHITDMQVVQRFADNISATNDNLRGVINTGGRKSATEVRQSGEAGASRLAAQARLVSAQSICPLAEMEVINLQQNMSMEVYLKILGQDAMAEPLKIAPEDIAGDFYYPVHDGTLPLDRVALLDVWKELFLGLLQVPQLAAQYDVAGIFEYMAKLGGATNLSTFKQLPQMQAQMAPQDAIAQQVAAGNMVPAGTQAGPGGPGQ